MTRRLPLCAAACLLLFGACNRSDRIDRTTIRNVLVITMDTTRADHLGAYGYDAIDTPIIDGLAARGVRFETAISTAPVTLPAHTSLFTGLLPTRHGVRDNGTFHAAPHLETLAEMLRARGFATAAVVGAFVLDAKFGLDQGFATYDDDLHRGKEGPMFMFDERPAHMVSDAAIAWLETPREQPFFLWLHYFDPHANYEPPAPFDVLYEDAPYDGEIAAVDQEIGRVLATLDAMNATADTLIVLTADHGEGLGDHGERTHSLLIYDSTMRVPLIFAHPSLPQGRTVTGPASLVDVLPTIADLTQTPIDHEIDGISLTPSFASGHVPERNVYFETFVPRFNNGWSELRGIRNTHFKYISAPRSELYAIDRDPAETKNLLGDEPQAAATMAAELQTFVDADLDDPFGDNHARIRLSSADRARLHALGYDPGDDVVHSGNRADPKDKIESWENFQTAQHLLRSGDADAGLEALREVITQDPGNVLAYGSLANTLLARGDLDAAQEAFEQVIRLDPRRLHARLGLARVQRRKGDSAAAFATLKEALREDSREPELANEFADLFQENGDPERAIQWYEEALRRDPDFVKAMIGLSNTYHRQGRTSEARAVLERALAIDPDNADAHYNLGVVTEALGNDEQAASSYRRTLEIDPDHIQALNNLGSFFDRSGDPARAARMYARVLEASPQHFEATYNLGTIRLRQGAVAEATTLLERASQLAPGSTLVLHNLALAYEQAERYDEAAQALQRGAAIDTQNAGWWVRLAQVAVSAGSSETATAHLTRAIEIGGASYRQRIEAIPQLAPLLPPADPQS